MRRVAKRREKIGHFIKLFPHEFGLIDVHAKYEYLLSLIVIEMLLKGTMQDQKLPDSFHCLLKPHFFLHDQVGED